MQGTPRTLFCVAVATSTLAWLLVLVMNIAFAADPAAPALLLPITAVAGTTFGATWTLMSVVTSELFGLQHFALNYATVQLAPAAAACVCPTLLVGLLYDHAAWSHHSQDNHDHPIQCHGRSCFLPAFLLLTLLAVLVRPVHPSVPERESDLTSVRMANMLRVRDIVVHRT